MQLIVSVLAVIGLATTAQAQPVGWSTQRSVAIVETSGTSLTNYQVRMVFDSAALISGGLMNADASDLRFGADAAGSTLLNYWIESGVNTATTVVWIRLPALPASSTTGIYLFTGNPAAASASTLAVFDYQDLLNNSATNQVASGGPGGVTTSQRGFRFSPNEDVLLIQFGKNEPTGTTRYITLFDNATQAVLAQTQVSGPAATYSYANVAQPLWLTQGTQYLLEMYQGASDGYYFGLSTQINPKLTYYDMRYCNSCTQNTFPTNFLSNYQYGYPDFEFMTRQHASSEPVATLAHALAITVVGSGTVSAAPVPAPSSGSIAACDSNGGSNCAAEYPGGVQVTVNTTPATGWHFAAWGGDCASDGSVTMDADKACTATFAIDTHAISGAISGLDGSGLTLHLDYGSGTEDLSPANGAAAFAFASPVPFDAPYAITVTGQPGGLNQTCAVTTDPSGNMPDADVTDVVVTCTTNTYSVGGSISGLSGSNLQLQINGGNTLTPAAGATSFAFPALADGTAWTVSVANQPDTPTQTCNVALATAIGTLAGANVNSVSVNCTTNSYTVGGSIGGLTGSGLMLQLNGGNDLAASGSAFTFATPIHSGSSYIVSISAQPSGQTCNVTSAAGTVTNADITTVAVNCIAAQAQLTLSIDDGGAYARYGQVLDYLVTLSNGGNATAANIVLGNTASPGLDLANATWQCLGGDASATCTSNGAGALTDTATLPPGRSLTWLVSVPVLGGTSATGVTMNISATGASSVSDTDTLVIFRDTFDQAYGDGTNRPIPASSSSGEIFALPVATANIADVYKSQSENVRVQSIALGGETLVRLVAREGAQERATAWTRAQPGAVLAAGSVEGEGGKRVMLLEGAEHALALEMTAAH